MCRHRFSWALRLGVLAAACVPLVADASPDGAWAKAAGSPTMAHFTDCYLSFSYPSTWRAETYVEVSSFTNALVFLSPQTMHPPCVTVHKSTETITSCGQPFGHLAPGGVLVEWWVDGFLDWSLAKAPGRPITVGGRRAKEALTKAVSACPAGAAQRLTVEVARQVPHNLYEMTACLSSRALAAERAQVQAMLGTVHFRRP